VEKTDERECQGNPGDDESDNPRDMIRRVDAVGEEVDTPLLRLDKPEIDDPEDQHHRDPAVTTMPSSKRVETEVCIVYHDWPPWPW